MESHSLLVYSASTEAFKHVSPASFAPGSRDSCDDLSSFLRILRLAVSFFFGLCRKRKTFPIQICFFRRTNRRLTCSFARAFFSNWDGEAGRARSLVGVLASVQNTVASDFLFPVFSMLPNSAHGLQYLLDTSRAKVGGRNCSRMARCFRGLRAE